MTGHKEGGKRTKKKKKRHSTHSKRPLLFLAVTLLLIGVIIVAAAVIQENHELALEEEEYELLSAELKVSEEEPESEMLPEEATPAFSAESEPPEGPEESETTDDPDETEELTEVYLFPEEESAEEAEDEPQQGDNPQEYSPGGTNPGSPSSPTQQAQTGYTGANLSACKKKNSEFIAWLKIPGTKVDYPVVLTDRVDYYLVHNFNGKQSKMGTLFSLAKTDYETPGRNIAIYGHHITNTSSGQKMFRPLFSYKQKGFYDKHSTVYLDTLYHCGKYRIFAVINYVNGDWDPSTAYFANDDTFMDFIGTAQSLSLYDTGVTVTATDHIITLITCDRTFAAKEGRLVVMAVEQ